MAHYDVVIIGTGSANTVLGKPFRSWKAAIVEQAPVFGGTCLNVGCVPTKMLVHPADLAHDAAHHAPRLGVTSELRGVRWPEIRDRVFGRIDPIAESARDYRIEHEHNSHITVHRGHGRFVGEKALEVVTDAGTETLTADRVVIGAGSRPAVPPVQGLAAIDHHTSDTVMRMDRLPESMLILGSGFVAAEFAHIFTSYGVAVTQVARSGALLRSHDGDISRRFTDLASRRWDVRLDSDAVAARRTPAGVELDLARDGDVDTVVAETLLVATGRVPNSDLLQVEATGVTTDEHGGIEVDAYQRTSVPGIYALGDISTPYPLKHVANHEARVVRYNLQHPDQPMARNHRAVPHAVFTHPEIAGVGLTEEAARDQGIRYVTATHEYADVAYGWAMADTTGFVKLLADPATGRLLGAHILGPQAPTLLQPVSQAMAFDLDVQRMARGQYWIHPALTEVVENALLALDVDWSPESLV